ncbi:hypothetical protein PCANC_24732 [Puccinia coronata f. sp. avenae]|uniref:Uncharacterized protein n=1 Tax=Puccinia coronata f. sp. avenae TaxID=200324 RepID=A0A2N5TZX6_9BASI|nr:hypothetical protein PCANC_24732 [Puccinia coronata f. sp. avenae]
MQHRNRCATLQKAANQRSAAVVRFSWPQLAIAAAVNRYLQRQPQQERECGSLLFLPLLAAYPAFSAEFPAVSAEFAAISARIFAFSAGNSAFSAGELQFSSALSVAQFRFFSAKSTAVPPLQKALVKIHSVTLDIAHSLINR